MLFLQQPTILRDFFFELLESPQLVGLPKSQILIVLIGFLEAFPHLFLDLPVISVLLQYSLLELVDLLPRVSALPIQLLLDNFDPGLEPVPLGNRI